MHTLTAFTIWMYRAHTNTLYFEHYIKQCSKKCIEPTTNRNRQRQLNEKENWKKNGKTFWHAMYTCRVFFSLNSCYCFVNYKHMNVSMSVFVLFFSFKCIDWVWKKRKWDSTHRNHVMNVFFNNNNSDCLKNLFTIDLFPCAKFVQAIINLIFSSSYWKIHFCSSFSLLPSFCSSFWPRSKHNRKRLFQRSI